MILCSGPSTGQPAEYLLNSLRFTHREKFGRCFLETCTRLSTTSNLFLHMSVFVQIKLKVPMLQFGTYYMKNIMGEMAVSLNELSVFELCAGLAAKNFSAVEVARSLTQHVQQNSDLGSIASFDPASYHKQAEEADVRRKAGGSKSLDGIPLILKDNIDTKDLPTTGGTGALAGRRPSKDALAVTALRRAGAIIPAKAVMHELAFGITSNNYVTGPARNPYDKSKIPGGSSGGTGSAVSSRQFPAGLGTDTGGSVRIPSALCGIVGFRPTVGRYPGDGVIPISKTRDTIGPMARTMQDIALLDSVMANNAPPGRMEVNLKSIRIGLPRTRFWENLEHDVEEHGKRLIQILEGEGVTLIEADFPDIWDLNDNTGFPIALFEVMRELPAYLQRAGYNISIEDLISGIGSPDVKGILLRQLGDEAMPEAAYSAAMEQHRPEMQKIYGDYFVEHEVDAILFPTTPLTARPIGEDETVELNGNQQPTFPIFIRNTELGSNIGAPGISLPVGLGKGLPVGMEIDGLPGKDEHLIAIASTIETLLDPVPAP